MNKCIAISLILLLTLTAGTAIAAEDGDKDVQVTYTSLSWDDFVQKITLNHEGEDVDGWEEYVEQLEWMHSHPMDINTATVEEMLALPLLTPAQVEAIQAYVHLDGPMKSLGELALIPALDPMTREVLPLFFVVRDNTVIKKRNKGWLGNMENSMDSRMDIPLYYRKGYQNGKYSATPLYSRVRYSLESDNVLAGVHCKKDPGERFYDSYGGYAMIRDRGMVRTAIVGDYRAGWGEGLVIGRSSLVKSNIMVGTTQGIRPMTGVSESGFLRGVAVTLGNSKKASSHKGFNMEGTLFASHLAIDATLNPEGGVQTIVTNGYHRTDSERAKKHNTHTTLAGAHVQASAGHWVWGVTGYWQHFNRVLEPGDDKYRRWYPRGRDFGVIGVHSGYSRYRWSTSAEVAYSTENSGIAAIGRAQWMVSRNLKIGALGRYYSHKFHSFQASAMAENSRVQNEKGAMLRIEAQPLTWLSFTGYADFFADYWPRYGMTSSSYGQDFMAEGRFLFTDRNSLSLRYQLKRKAANDLMLGHHKMRLQWSFQASERWKMQSTIHAHMARTLRPGMGLSQMIQGSILGRDALKIGIVAAYFNAPDYGTRVYIHEPSLWNSTSTTSYYGHGLRMAGTVRYVFPKGHLMLEAKYSITHMLDRKTISSGLQEILSPTRQDVSLQAKVNF